MDNLPVPQQAMLPISTTVDSYDKGLVTYLTSLGLPTEKVLIAVAERGKVLLNLPDVDWKVPPTNLLEPASDSSLGQRHRKRLQAETAAEPDALCPPFSTKLLKENYEMAACSVSNFARSFHPSECACCYKLHTASHWLGRLVAW